MPGVVAVGAVCEARRVDPPYCAISYSLAFVDDVNVYVTGSF